MSSRVWLVTGAAGGLGRAVTERVLGAGERLIALTRSPERLALPAEGHPGRLLAVRADITDPAQVRQAVEDTVGAFGRLDVVVNNAGYALPGPLEELDEKDLRAQFDINVFGPVNVLRATLPYLRAARRGHVLQISSIAGQSAAAGMSAYTGSKHALEGISVSLAAELAPLGVHLTIVEPGAARTDFRRRWTDRAAGRATIADYAPVHQALSATGADAESRRGDPARIADALYAVAGMDRPPLRLPLGSDAVAAIRRARTAQLEDLDRHEALSLSSDERFGG
ncbi:SDR family NAD(P)-dependent oxidoreductase [Actinoallomurus rhizosphaericola]|uniref:SDR family NAD(P)-dependent oxidoreductase n=1 Tax=Actinoallomurus rhizosphaericola TaxID=2952536 RepID=UPI002090A7C7|nr:SDR family NAD(P)-dependent oxidoreductase [Actinoallomurus rhizosphaericola]MCO5994220.1 SDR family NAD(P)-dependent oxidoreductase [Actinoallomurus rhizosphaericola]